MESELVDSLARLGIFRDLSTDELAAVASSLETATFREGEHIMRRGQENASLYVIVEGEAGVWIDDEDRGLLVRGSFFGEISALLSEPATADIVTRSPLRCLVVPAENLEQFLVNNPRIMFRVLQVEARRLQRADGVART
jgi:eukaryotic-like serine/threonine-protein kinase